MIERKANARRSIGGGSLHLLGSPGGCAGVSWLRHPGPLSFSGRGPQFFGSGTSVGVVDADRSDLGGHRRPVVVTLGTEHLLDLVSPVAVAVGRQQIT